MGGLMQLVAYGAQDIYLGGNPTISFYKSSKPKHTQFFYDKIKNNPPNGTNKQSLPQFKKSKTASEKSMLEHYLGSFWKPVKKLNMYQRAQKHFGSTTIVKMKSHINRMKHTNDILTKFVADTSKFNFTKKDQMVNIIRPVINVMRNKLFLNQSKKYFSNQHIDLYALYKFNLNMGNLTSSVKKLDQLMVIHQILLANIEPEDRIIKNSDQMKNDICPITMEPINHSYIQCTTCNTCFDYDNQNVITWFKNKSICAVCKQKFPIVVKHKSGENIVLNELKNLSKNT